MGDPRIAAERSLARRRTPSAAHLLLPLALLLHPHSDAQNAAGSSAQSVATQMNQRMNNLGNPFGDLNPAVEQKRLRALNQERQRTMIADAAKLLRLTTELNGQLNGSSHGAATADDLHKLNEIEKLARSIKDKMSYAVEASPESGLPQRFP